MAAVLLLILGVGAILVYSLNAYRLRDWRNVEAQRSRFKERKCHLWRRAPELTQLWPREKNTRDATIECLHPLFFEFLTDISSIVAIHGLDTQSPVTWQAFRNRRDDAHGHVNWLRDENMLHARLPEAGIYTYDWLSTTYDNAVQDSLRGHADTFLEKLRHRPSPGRHLILVASCFGGLLLAEAVTRAFNERNLHSQLLRELRGILFLGTPFRKSDAGNAALVRVRIAKAMGAESSDELIKYLTTGSDALTKVVEDFDRILRSNAHQIGLISYYETKATQIYNAVMPRWIANVIPSGNLVLVPRESVDIAGCQLFPLNVKHALLNKYFGPDDGNFQAVCSGLNELISQAKRSDIQSLLQKYYQYNDGQRLRIERLSGRLLSMERCYINLCIVERDRDNSNRTAGSSTNSTKFSLPYRLRVENPPVDRQVTLETLFNVRTQLGGVTARPKRILIWGRAGVGKSTLCKKIVHDFVYNRLWEDMFDYIFWIPLRELNFGHTSSFNLEEMVLKKFFRVTDQDSARSQFREIPQNRMLFVLDGLDEVSYSLHPDAPEGGLLQQLLECDNIIVTSRPHNTKILLDAPPDLELETIGFFPAQVEEYLDAVEEQSLQTKAQVRAFIQNHPVMQSLVRIPIQLDAICYCWRSSLASADIVTTTLLYQEIESRLWEKYLTWRDDLVPSVVQDLETRPHVQKEHDFLAKLAFNGLFDGIIEFDVKYIAYIQTDLEPVLNDKLVYMPFLRSSDNSCNIYERTFHFIHLTFQEYFAARYFVQHWVGKRRIDVPKSCKNQRFGGVGAQDLLREEKYSTRYDIFWRFVTGLLQEQSDEDLRLFFTVLESEPRDLLGPAHQRLIIHCLSEVKPAANHVKLRDRLTEEYRQWILFENRFNSSTSLAHEIECPESVFLTLIKSPETRQVGRSSLLYRRNVSLELLSIVTDEVGQNSDQDTKLMAYRLLGANCHKFSQQQFIEFWQILCGLSLDEQTEIICALRNNQLPHPAVESLVRCLTTDKDSQIRALATEALSSQNKLSTTVVEALVERLTLGEDSMVRPYAAETIRKQSRLSVIVIKTLVQGLISNDSRIRSSAADSLGNQSLDNQNQLSPMVVEALVQCLTDGNSRVRNSAVSALGRLSYQKHLPVTVIEALVERLAADEDSWVRYEVATTLSYQNQLPMTVVEALVERLTPDEGSGIRYEVATVLGNQKHLPMTVVEALVKRLTTDEDSDIRSLAASALRYQKHLPVTVVEALVERLAADEDSWVRYEVATTLSYQNQLPMTVVEALVECLTTNEDFGIRSLAATVLGHQKHLPVTVVEALMERLTADEHFFFLCSTAKTLYYKKQLPVTVVEALVKRLTTNEDSRVRLLAVIALGYQKQLPVTVVEALVERLTTDEDSDIRYSAARALGYQEQLPDSILRTLLFLLQSLSSHTQIMSVLYGHKELYSLLPTLDPPSMRQLLRTWLSESFGGLGACFVKDTSLHIRCDGEPDVVISLEKAQLEIFQRARRELFEELGVPQSSLTTK